MDLKGEDREMEQIIRNQIQELEINQNKLEKQIKKLGEKLSMQVGHENDYQSLNKLHNQYQEHKFAIFNLYQVIGKQSGSGEKKSEEIGFIKALIYAAVLLTDFDSDAGQLLAESGYSAEDFRKYADEEDLTKIESWLDQLNES